MVLLSNFNQVRIKLTFLYEAILENVIVSTWEFFTNEDTFSLFKNENFVFWPL